jgi:hypothetical protein
MLGDTTISILIDGSKYGGRYKSMLPVKCAAG